MLGKLWFFGPDKRCHFAGFLSRISILILLACLITLTTTSAFAQNVQVYTDRSIVSEGDSVRFIFEVQGSVRPDNPLLMFAHISDTAQGAPLLPDELSDQFSFQSLGGLTAWPGANGVTFQLNERHSVLRLSVKDNKTPAFDSRSFFVVINHQGNRDFGNDMIVQPPSRDHSLFAKIGAIKYIILPNDLDVADTPPPNLSLIHI